MSELEGTVAGTRRRAGWPQGGGPPDQGADPVAASNALTARWARTHRDGNLVLSGVGSWIPLAALAAGAAGGDARDELAHAVGVPADGAVDAAASLLGLLRSIGQVRAALGIWTRVVLDPDWVARLPEGVVGGLSGDPDADRERIDRWVAEATAYDIVALPVAVTERTRLVLATALSLKLDWREPFGDAGTLQAGPWAGTGVPRLVRSTTDLARLRVLGTAVGNLTCVRVPGDRDVDVHLVMGEVGRSSPGPVLAAAIEAVVGTDTAATGRDVPEGEPAPGVRVERIEASDPGDRLVITTCAFDIRASLDLAAAAGVLGLATAMDRSRGHFPGISAVPLVVDQARQDATATFSRTGFRATAVMAISMGVGSARPGPADRHRVRRIEVSFDRPFAFVATHRPTGLVLAAGWVHDPAAVGRDRA